MTHYLYANQAESTLAGPISSSVTVINLAAGTGVLFPNPAANQAFYATLNDAATGLITEVVLVTARSTDQLTVVRGQQGTTAVSWLVNDLINQLTTAGDLSNFVQPDDLQAQAGNYAVDTGTANALVVVLSPAPTPFRAGTELRIKKSAIGPNTAAATLLVNSGGPYPIVLPGGGSINPGQLPAAAIFTGVFDGTNFVLQSGGVSGLGTAAFKTASSNSVQNLASIIGSVQVGNFAVWADPNGSIKDGGTPGTAALKTASSISLTDLASVLDATTGNLAGFVDDNGSIGDTGIEASEVLTTTGNLAGLGSLSVSRSNLGIIYYRTGNYTPTPGTGYAENHNLGARPAKWDVDVFLQCLTAEGGYSIGDAVPFALGGSSGLSPAVTPFGNDTQVGASFTSTITTSLTTKGGGTSFNITPGHWTSYAIMSYY